MIHRSHHLIGASELRSALRGLGRKPAFVAAAVCSLALGIASTTAVFSLLDAIMLRPLPYPDGDRLALLSPVLHGPGGETDLGFWTSRQIEALEHSAALPASAGFFANHLSLGTAEGAQRLKVEYVTKGYFELLGIAPGLGRTFSDSIAKSTDSNHAHALLSEAAWQRWFGGDPTALGQSLLIEGRSFRLLGVLPAGFEGLSGQVDVWLPTGAAAGLESPGLLDGRFWLQAVARLPQAPNGPFPLPDLGAAVLDQAPLPGAWQVERLEVRAVGLRHAHVDPRIRRPLGVLGATAILVLLIACANVANLLLSRGLRRRRELGVRRSLGASRWQLSQLLLLEGMLLAVLGGGLGMVLATLTVGALPRWAPLAGAGVWTPFSQALRATPIAIDGRMLAWALAASLVSGLVFSLAPLASAVRIDIRRVLSGAEASKPRRRFGAANLLVIAQVALSVTLLIGASLTLRTLDNLGRIDPGFEAEHSLAAQVDLPADRYADHNWQGFLEPVLEQLRTLPGVVAASSATALPLDRGSDRTLLAVEGLDRGPTDFEAARLVEFNVVDEGYLDAVGSRLVAGRNFTPGDGRDTTPVVMVSAAGASRLWPGESAVGRLVRLSVKWPSEGWAEVIGVVEDVRFGRLEQKPDTFFYLHRRQLERSDAYLLVRTAGDPSQLAEPLRQAVRSIDPAVAVFATKRLEQLAGEATSHSRFLANLLTLFAALALVLACGGIYGVMAFRVASRHRELGIRAALGASRRALQRLVLGEATLLITTGAVAGWLAARGLGRWLEQQLYGLDSGDPISLALTVGVLTACGLLAAYLPARRAGRSDPANTLRSE